VLVRAVTVIGAIARKGKVVARVIENTSHIAIGPKGAKALGLGFEDLTH
jgi:hypothetical protein